MSDAEEGLPRTENASGVVLGYWDHEKTPTLIQDLEQSISLVEHKCKKLLEELTHYKKYLEKPSEIDIHSPVFKKKNKKSLFISGSEPEITFRKNLIRYQKVKQVFEEKFQEKLGNINQELQEAAQKIGLNNSIILFPSNEYLKKLKEQLEYIEELQRNTESEREDEDDVKEEFNELKTLKAKAKSDSVITDGDPDFSKITKNQLELYQKLSKLSMKKKKYIKKLKKKSCKRKKAKFFRKRKTLSFCQGLPTCRDSSVKSKPSKKTLKKRKKKVAVILQNKSHSPREFGPKVTSGDSKKVKSRATSASADCRNPNKSPDNFKKSELEVALEVALRKPVPFTACTSTSKSYNIGLNVQQLLSLPKYERKANVRLSASEKMHGSSRRTNNEGLTCKPSGADMKKRPSTPWTHTQMRKSNIYSEEHKENAWISELFTSSNHRKTRSKATGRSATGVFKYLKTSQFTNGQKSMIQSQSKAAYAVGSKIMVSDCQRTDIFELGKSSKCFKNASGDGKGNDKLAELNTEWTKVYSSFLKTYRKYTCLKEKISDSELGPANEELKSLEKDIECSIEKYKEFLQYYSKFLHLNHRLKSLKIACETKTFEPVTSFSSNCQRKFWRHKPTNSMAMKDAFREVQALQAKINLVSD